MVSYGERPPLLHELRAGLEQAATEAGPSDEKGRWFLASRDALPAPTFPTTQDICRYSISARSSLRPSLVSTLRPF